MTKFEHLQYLWVMCDFRSVVGVGTEVGVGAGADVTVGAGLHDHPLLNV